MGGLDFGQTPISFAYANTYANGVEGSQLPSNFGEVLGKTVLKMMMSPWYDELKRVHFHDGVACPGEGPSETSGDVKRVKLLDLYGLFVVSGSIGVLALLISFADWAWQLWTHRSSARIGTLRHREVEPVVTEAEMLRLMAADIKELRSSVEHGRAVGLGGVSANQQLLGPSMACARQAR